MYLEFVCHLRYTLQLLAMETGETFLLLESLAGSADLFNLKCSVNARWVRKWKIRTYERQSTVIAGERVGGCNDDQVAESYTDLSSTIDIDWPLSTQHGVSAHEALMLSTYSHQKNMILDVAHVLKQNKIGSGRTTTTCVVCSSAIIHANFPSCSFR